MYTTSRLQQGRAARIKALIDEAKAACERLQRYYVAQAADAGEARDALQYIGDTIGRIPDEQVPPEAVSAATKFRDYVTQMEQKAMGAQLDVATHAYALTTTISSTASFVTSASWDDNSGRITEVPKPPFWPHERLADIPIRLERLHPPLLRVFQSAKESFLAGVAEPERRALYAMRELLDHFFAELAPNDEVRASAHFKLKDGPDKNKIHRRERILFVAHERVKDEIRRQVLIANAEHVLAVYKRLQKAHERGPLRREDVHETLRAVLALVDEWTESLCS